MNIIYGSMRHTPSGRKRKTKAYRKSKVSSTTPFRELQPTTNVRYEESLKLREKYPSMEMGTYKPFEDQSYKKEISDNYTVAPAYNKGAYQVISKENIKHIGK